MGILEKKFIIHLDAIGLDYIKRSGDVYEVNHKFLKHLIVFNRSIDYLGTYKVIEISNDKELNELLDDIDEFYKSRGAIQEYMNKMLRSQKPITIRHNAFAFSSNDDGSVTAIKKIQPITFE